jgi:hypothetical protein
LLTVVALRDSAPLAGLARAAPLSSESSSSRSLISITRLFLVGFLDLGFVLPDRATATLFIEVVRDFTEAPEARNAGTDWEALESSRGTLLPDLLAGKAFLGLDIRVWEEISLCNIRQVIQALR